MADTVFLISLISIAGFAIAIGSFALLVRQA